MSPSGRVLFMSGTGNSYRVGCWLQERMAAHGLAAELLPIEVLPPDGGRPPGYLAVVFPTHAFTAPWPVLRGLWRLPRQQGARAMVLACRAGWTAGDAPMPGLEGTAAYLAALLLRLKGCRVRGVLGLDMPSNWTAVHWGLSPEHARRCIEAARVKAAALADRVLAGGSDFSGRLSLAAGVLLFPVSLGYLLLGRFLLAKLFFASHRCTGCGLCAETCPHGGVVMAGPRPYWTFRCESCMRCMNYCPQRAIECSHSLAVLLYYAAAASAAPYVLRLLGVFGACALFQTAVAWSPVNRFFFYTTLTPLLRRYHEPSTAVRDMTQAGQKGRISA